jgi:hypothetical protein
MKLRIFSPIFVTLVLTVAVNGQGFKSGPQGDPSPFLVRYFANLSFADSYIDMTNDGSQITSVVPFFAEVEGQKDPNATAFTGNICANVYTFDANEEMVSCCTCPITPDGLKSLSVKNDLVSNTLTPGVPLAVVVKLVATTPVVSFDIVRGPTTLTNGCDATIVPYPFANLNPGTAEVTSLHAWGITPHLNTAAGAYQLTETAFSNASLSNSEINHITSICAFTNTVGSGFGICKSCLVRGLGAARE